MKKVFGIMGSPRKGSHTDKLLDAVLEGAAAAGAEVKKVGIGELSVQPCASCYACARTGKCVLQDDMQDVYQEMSEADVIVLASPLYFFGVSAQLKALIDRAQVYWSRKNELKVPGILPEKQRLGYFICTGGAPNRSGNNFEPAVATAKIFFMALDAHYVGDLIVANTDQITVANRPELLAEAQAAGRALVEDGISQ